MRSRACCRKDAPTPRVSAKPCFSCGELRKAEWFYADSRTPTGLQARCMPCMQLRDQQRLERINRARKSLEPAAEKECRTCEKTLPVSSFHKTARNLDGFQNDCKECRSKAVHAIHAERKEHFAGQPPVAPAGEERICSACGTAKPWSEFHKDSRSMYGIKSRCKQCITQQQNVYRRLAQTGGASES